MLIEKILNYFLPATCLLCGYNTHEPCNLCQACLQDLPALPMHCYRCGHFLSGSSANQLCGACLSSPPPFDKTFILFPYVSPISNFIAALKFKHELYYSKTFAELLIQQIPHWYASKALPDMLIPMPLHAKRVRERGFNQALEVARAISRRFSLPIDIKGVIRSKYTQPQSLLAAKERQQNVANAFLVRRDYQGLHIAVIDDVITTGYTLHVLCEQLKKAGATQIDVWCCAKGAQFF